MFEIIYLIFGNILKNKLNTKYFIIIRCEIETGDNITTLFPKRCFPVRVHLLQRLPVLARPYRIKEFHFGITSMS